MRPLLLDLYCGAGGASMGYHRAGFEVVGVDLEAQPRYPFEFHRGDAIEIGMKLLADRPFVGIVGSPPCKGFSSIRHVIKATSKKKHDHVNMIPATRDLMISSGLPYVIENVPGAPLIDPVMLCGSMFPSRFVRRHRVFEFGHFSMRQPVCRHARQTALSPGFLVQRYHSGVPISGWSATAAVYGRGAGGGPGEVEGWRKAMGIDWMVRDELSRAIPPDYTHKIGNNLMKYLSR